MAENPVARLFWAPRTAHRLLPRMLYREGHRIERIGRDLPQMVVELAGKNARPQERPGLQGRAVPGRVLVLDVAPEDEAENGIFAIGLPDLFIERAPEDRALFRRRGDDQFGDIGEPGVSLRTSLNTGLARHRLLDIVPGPELVTVKGYGANMAKAERAAKIDNEL